MNIINLFDTNDFVKAGKEKHRGSLKDVSKNFDAKKLGFHLETLDPKMFSCPYHWHEGEEELFIILEGEVTIRCNGEFRIVKKGDLIFYNTGPDSVHQMYNHTDQPCKFFALSNDGGPDACHYPDSKKHSSLYGYVQNGVEVDYYKDEEDPSIYWPKDKL